MGDLIRKSDVLETYADLYDIFDDNKAIQEELHKVFDKINDIPTVEPNSSEKPNNSLDKDTNVRSKEPQIEDVYFCDTCKHDLWHTPRMCGKCVRQEDGTPSMYEPKTEPQTDRSE